MATIAELRQLLKEDCSGKNLYDHLTETLMKVLLDRPGNAYDNFELISADVKANPLTPDPEKGKPIPPSADEELRQRTWTQKCAALLKVPEEPPGESAVAFPDLIDEANMLEWAGVSLGKGEIYRLFLSIKKLAESLPGDVASLRFFGKINTRGAPYYIVEGLSPEDEEGIIDTQQEGRNGANKYAYWVIQSVESDSWVKLPNVKMAQIVIARQFKRLLTGNLDAPVPSYPPFPGTEKNLLRAQIARIVGSTSVSPEGFFEKDEEQDPPTVKRPEEIPFKNGSDLKESTSWRHHEIELNRMGRITKMPEQTDENGEPIADEEQYNEPLMELTPESWTFRVCPAGSGVSASSVGVARSTVWPGALAVASGRKFVNVYIGNAIIYEATTYTPPLPGPIQGEWMPSEEFSLVEQPDVRKDPTPPAPEGAEE